MILYLLILFPFIFLIVWRGKVYFLKYPEYVNASLVVKLSRWVLLLLCSIYTTAISIVVAFVIRYWLDVNISSNNGNPLLAFRNIFINTHTFVFPLLISAPLIYLISKLFKFSKPIIPTIIVFIFWQVLFFLF